MQIFRLQIFFTPFFSFVVCIQALTTLEKFEVYNQLA